MAVKKHTQLFKQDDRLFKALIENSWDVVVLVDAKARVLYSSPSSVRMFGRDYDEFVGIDNFKFLHPLDSIRIASLFTQILLHPFRPIHTEMRIRHKDGHYVWIEAIATNFLKDESIKGIVVNFHDITELKKSEEKKD